MNSHPDSEVSPEPLNLSIGLELECFIQYNWTHLMTKDEGHTSIFRHLAYALHEANLPVNACMPSGEYDSYTAWSLDYDFTLNSEAPCTRKCGGKPTPPLSMEEITYNDSTAFLHPPSPPLTPDGPSAIPTEDCSPLSYTYSDNFSSIPKDGDWGYAPYDPAAYFGAPPPPGESVPKIHPLEVKSPILFDKEDWETQVRTALSALHAAFPPEQIWTNDTCGLHTHLGAGINPARFSLRTLKSIGILCYAWERMIDCLHPPCRVNATKWAAPLSSNVLVAGVGVVGFAEIVEGGTEYETVLQLLGTGKERAYKFGQLDGQGMCPPVNEDPLYPLRQTIEFRQHIGTLDAELVINWVRFVAALVKFAHSLPEGSALEMVKAQAKGEGPRNVFEIMELIGVPHLKGFYQERLWEH